MNAKRIINAFENVWNLKENSEIEEHDKEEIDKIKKQNKEIIYLTVDSIIGVVFFDKEIENIFKNNFVYGVNKYGVDMNDEIGFTKFSIEHLKKIIKLFYDFDDTIKIFNTKDYPIHFKNEYFMVILAPRTDGED